MILTRRSMLVGLITAPAIVKASSLMRISSRLILPSPMRFVMYRKLDPLIDGFDDYWPRDGFTITEGEDFEVQFTVR